MENKVNVFKNKNYALLFYGVLVSNVAHILFNFVMSLYVLRIAKEVYGETYAPLVQGVYLGVAGLVLLVFMPFGGVLADRINKVRIMYLTDYIRGFVILSVGLIIFINPSSSIKLIALFAMNVILGLNSAFFNPASGSLLKFIVTEDELPQASSLLHGSMSLQNIAGLILGGIMFSALNIYVIFFINGLAYLISAVTEMFIKYDHNNHREDKDVKVFQEIKSGIKYLYNYKAMFSLLLMALTLNFFTVPIINNAFPYFIDYGLSSETNYLFESFLTVENWYSVILICFSVAGIIMAVILAKTPKKESYGNALMGSIFAFGVAIAFMASVMILYYLGYLSIDITLILTVVSCLIAGLASTKFNVPVQIIMQNNIDHNQLGKVVSVSNVMSQALIPFASLMAGFVISQFSIISLYILCTVGLGIVILIYYKKKTYVQL
ncbi:MAG TPA: MFS transporter [Bacillota bacterium]|nr:MFS transporter [Bacillota bacterium]